jgi:bifunctional ADP-heptose synthase (sugar kinase/adenylyltransferase)
MDDGPALTPDIEDIVKQITDVVRRYDFVIVADYGHGMMATPVVDVVTQRARFLSVNTQCNAGNHGFNTISKYNRADYVCLAEREMEMETRRTHTPIQELAELALSCIHCPNFTITRGKTGTVHFDSKGNFVEVPSLAREVVDRIGAGDTVLAVTTPMVMQGAPWDLVGFVANIAGAQAVAQLGNRQPVNAASLARTITALMR